MLGNEALVVFGRSKCWETKHWRHIAAFNPPLPCPNTPALFKGGFKCSKEKKVLGENFLKIVKLVKCHRLKAFAGSSQKRRAQRSPVVVIVSSASHAHMQRQLKGIESGSDFGFGLFHFLVIVVSHFDMVAEQVRKTLIQDDDHAIIRRTQSSSQGKSGCQHVRSRS